MIVSFCRLEGVEWSVVKKFENIKSPNNISEIKNKKILIWDEQGLGDTINFSRFVIDTIKFTKKVTFVVDKKLKDILFIILIIFHLV